MRKTEREAAAYVASLMVGVAGDVASAQSYYWPPEFSVDAVRCNDADEADIEVTISGVWFCSAIPTGVRVEPGNVVMFAVVEWDFPFPPPCAAVLTPWRYSVRYVTRDLNRTIPILAIFDGPLNLPLTEIGAIVPNCCTADRDDGSGRGRPDGGVTIDDLLYYLRLYGAGAHAADVDDGSGTGTRDGGVTIEDLLYFLDRYSAGC